MYCKTENKDKILVRLIGKGADINIYEGNTVSNSNTPCQKQNLNMTDINIYEENTALNSNIQCVNRI